MYLVFTVCVSAKLSLIEETCCFVLLRRFVEMAGNIIPAIASTNAIIAGMLVLQALHALRRSWSAARFVSLSRTTQRVFTSFPPSRPNPACGVCQDVYISLRADTSRLTLGELVEDIAKRSRDEGGMGIEAEVGVYESSRLLYDPDFEDNVEKTLKDLGAVAGTMIAVVDEDGEKATVNFVIEEME